MAYVVAAIWTAKEGQEETILEVIKKMTPLSRQEPACLFYQVQRSSTDPRIKKPLQAFLFLNIGRNISWA